MVEQKDLQKFSSTGVGWVILAAILWATDALIRYPAIETIHPIWIVLVEHFLGVVLFFPWVFFHYPRQWFQLSRTEWLSALFSGLGGSAIATVLFTSSFLYTNPSTSILLQKLQPLFVVFLAYWILKEVPPKKLIWVAPLALVSAVFVSFPEGSFFSSLSKDPTRNNLLGVLFALGAAFLWASAVISGRFLLHRLPVSIATFWRFFFGLIGLFFLTTLAEFVYPSLGYVVYQWSTLLRLETLLPILYLSLIPGIFAMMVYYRGLSKTPAHITTFIELLYPIVGVILNTLILGTPLSWIQAVAALLLAVSIGIISF